jgi:WXXGXW repeat (2 copies)
MASLAGFFDYIIRRVPAEPADQGHIAMFRPLRLLLCASTVALILGAAPVGVFVAPAQAQIVDINAPVAPPPLPLYAQPPIPGVGYLWIPGRWAWDGTEYYWAPGYWEEPPYADLYWTPGYWAWNDADNGYIYNAGYWGPTVGYYGGINYGFGYSGQGYQGGYWRNHRFFYNQAANNLGGAHIPDAYSQPIPPATNHVAYNGGKGGTTVKPTPDQIATSHEHHIPPTAEQVGHDRAASQIDSLRYSANHGQPPIAATERAGDVHGQHGAAAAGAAGQTTPHQAPTIAGSGMQHRGAGGANIATTPAMPQNLASHALMPHSGTIHRNFGYHGPMTPAPGMHQNFAYHAPMFHAPAINAGGMNVGAAPQIHVPQMGGVPMPAMPHFGGVGAPNLGGGGVHIGGVRMPATPHFGGIAPNVAGGGMHIGGAPIGGGIHIGGAPGLRP